MRPCLFLSILLPIVFTGCKKEGVDAFEAKYEIITTAPVVVGGAYPFVWGRYTEPPNNDALTVDFKSGTFWTKTCQFAARRREIVVYIVVDESYLTSAGSVTANIYINGVKTKSQTVNTVFLGGKHIVPRIDIKVAMKPS